MRQYFNYDLYSEWCLPGSQIPYILSKIVRSVLGRDKESGSGGGKGWLMVKLMKVSWLLPEGVLTSDNMVTRFSKKNYENHFRVFSLSSKLYILQTPENLT